MKKIEPKGKSSVKAKDSLARRQRIHELLIALINKQENLELMDPGLPRFDGFTRQNKEGTDPADLLNRNRRILEKYQALARSAITLDALLDSKWVEDELGSSASYPYYILSKAKDDYWLMNTQLKTLMLVKSGIEVTPVDYSGENTICLIGHTTFSIPNDILVCVGWN